MDQLAYVTASNATDRAASTAPDMMVRPQDRLYVLDSRPTALLIGDGVARPSTAAMLIGAGGARLLDRVSVAEAAHRLDMLTRVDLILVEYGDSFTGLAGLLMRLDRMAVEQDAAVIVSCGLDGIDLAFGALTADRVQLLCDPDPLDLAAAIALALRTQEAAPIFGDVGRESEAARIEMLSVEVGRLARVLDSLTRADSRGGAPLPSRMADRGSAYIGEATTAVGSRPAAALAPGQLRDLLRARRQRDQYFPADLFADPAWDMMLDLMAARLGDERVSVSSLCIAAAVPPTTALRWIRQLTDRGLFHRQADPADGRRVFIALADEAADAVTRWFSASQRILRDALG